MSTDFSTSLYLGMLHDHGELTTWKALTTGVPAAFMEKPEAMQLGQSVARLQGLEAGVLAPSTLHLFWDWFGGLDPRRSSVFVDAALYRVGAGGVERAAGRGVPVHTFRHLCPESLHRLMRDALHSGQQPIVVTDGWCPFCARAAPLDVYLRLLEPLGGLLVLDDTQALGILGRQPDAEMPYGHGGGGLCRYQGVTSRHLLVVASLAKAFGAPVAALCGAREQIQAFVRRSETRVYAGPVSAASIAAGQHALTLNAASGAQRRRKLLANVRFFRACMQANGVKLMGGIFPVQTISLQNENTGLAIHRALRQQGVLTVPVRAHDGSSRLCWLLSARHSEKNIAQACRVFFDLMRRNSINHDPFLHSRAIDT